MKVLLRAFSSYCETSQKVVDSSSQIMYLWVLGAVLLLEGPPVLDIVEPDVGGDDAGEERHEGALLQLVDQDRGVALTCTVQYSTVQSITVQYSKV